MLTLIPLSGLFHIRFIHSFFQTVFQVVQVNCPVLFSDTHALECPVKIPCFHIEGFFQYLDDGLDIAFALVYRTPAVKGIGKFDQGRLGIRP